MPRHPAVCNVMTNSEVPLVIITQWVPAERLIEMRAHLPTPLFVSEGEEREDNGVRTRISRMVSTASAAVGTYGEYQQQVEVQFFDGSPGVIFEPGDEIAVHMIAPVS